MSRVTKTFFFLWSFIFLTIGLTAIVPVWRSAVLLRLWAFNGWSEDSIWKSWLTHSGPAALDLLLKQKPHKNSVIEQCLFDLKANALPRYWELIAQAKNSGEVDYLASLLVHNKSPEKEASIRQQVTSSNAVVRRTAIEMSLRFLNDRQEKWLTDQDPLVRALALRYFIDEKTIHRALNDVSVVIKEVFYLALREVETSFGLKEEIRRYKSLPHFNPSDPTAISLIKPLEEKLKTLEEKLRIYQIAIDVNISSLLSQQDPELISLVYEWVGWRGASQTWIDQMTAHLDHENPLVRRKVILALARLKRIELAPRIWEIAQSDPEIIVQLSAWEALNQLKPPELLPKLREFIKKSSVESQKEELLKAFEIFKSIATLQDQALLEPFMEGYDYELAQAAKKIWQQISLSTP